MSWQSDLEELKALLSRVPAGFQDSGCSLAPDRLFGANLARACRVHDWGYCTRAHPPGVLTQGHRKFFDDGLGRWVRALVRAEGHFLHRWLGLGASWAGWVYYWATHRWGGVAAFDSCGPEVGPLCRHNLPPPGWMK